MSPPPEEPKQLPKVPFSTPKITEEKTEIATHHHQNKKKPTTQKGLFDEDEDEDSFFSKKTKTQEKTVVEKSENVEPKRTPDIFGFKPKSPESVVEVKKV